MWSPGINLSAPLANGLVGAWPMWEGDGDTVGDYSANGAAGAFVNMDSSNWRASDGGCVLDFGASDYVNVGTNDSLDVAGGDFSISLWASWTTATGNARAMVQLGWSGTAERCLLSTSLGNGNQDKVAFGFGQSASIVPWYYNAGSGLNDGTWHHIAGVRQGAAVAIYVDGESRGYSPSSAGVLDGNWISRGYHGEFLGLLSNVSIYNRALAPGEVASIYADPWRLYRQPDPLALWVAATASTPAAVAGPYCTRLTHLHEAGDVRRYVHQAGTTRQHVHQAGDVLQKAGCYHG
jgi:hypothetical protein